MPTATGSQTLSREGTEQGSPDQAFPKYKAVAILDWSGRSVSATLTGRYIKSVVETLANNNKLDSRFYTDFQLRFSVPPMGDAASLSCPDNESSASRLRRAVPGGRRCA